MTVRDTVNPVSNLFDAASHRRNIRLSCPRCVHSEVYHSAALWKLFVRNGWSDELRFVACRFYCPTCKREHGLKIKPVMALVDEDQTIALPLPDRAEWKRAISRRR